MQISKLVKVYGIVALSNTLGFCVFDDEDNKWLFMPELEGITIETDVEPDYNIEDKKVWLYREVQQ